MPREPISKDIMHFEPPYCPSVRENCVGHFPIKNFHDCIRRCLVLWGCCVCIWMLGWFKMHDVFKYWLPGDFWEDSCIK